ncbi:MAG TPA: phage portal protein, partial [Wenzhouxiangella sp.]|nr:phage portal protein [Wenzhouxiangella sp.]
MQPNQGPVIYDGAGNVISASSYGGEDRTDQALARWMPMLQAPDDEAIEGWETSVGRLRDLIRTNGITSGLVQTQLDSVIGPDLMLVPKPDYRYLGLSAEWAREFVQQVAPKWRSFAYDPEARIHASRVLDFPGLIRQGYRSRMMSGEIMATAEWIDRPNWPYRTAIQPFDPERVSTPAGKMDDRQLRHGIVKDRFGAPVGAFIREAHPHDSVLSQGQYRWRYIRRETDWGRLQFIHLFDQERPGQSRGRTGLLSGIKQIKMLERWQGTAMQAAIINSMYAAVVESSIDHPELMQALGQQAGDNPYQAYMADALEYHSGTNKIKWDGSKIAHLFPGEKLELMSAKQPVAAFEQFERAALRQIAAACNISYEQLSKDYTNTTYSSARASMLEAWKFILSERHHVANKYASIIYTLWLEDAISSGEVEVPGGLAAFLAPGAKRAFSQAKWIGPGREEIDPVKRANATRIDISLGLTSHEEEAAERGRHLEEIIDEQVALY